MSGGLRVAAVVNMYVVSASEIDVFESKGYDPSFLMSNIHTPRVGNPKKTTQHQGMMKGNTATSQTEWHTYGVLKTADAIEFYFDGNMTHRVKMQDMKGASNPFADPENGLVLKLNQMVGGSYLAKHDNWSDKTFVDASKYADDYKSADGAGSTMYVDYVRVYEPKTQADEPVQPEPTPAPAPEQPKPVTPAPAKPTPAPAKPTPAKPTPAQPVPSQPSQPSDNQADQNNQQSGQADQRSEQEGQSKQTKPEQPQKPKPQKPRPDRLANTGMTSWYRPVVVMWRSFCGWITSWWFW